MKAKIYTQDGTEKGTVDLPDTVFGCDVNEHCLHLVINSYLANQRQGNAKTKTRAEVSGGGAKPWRQKGTGRARAGSNTSPIWARGGKAFGPVPRSYSSAIPRKMKKIALRSALSSRAKEEKVYIVESLVCEKPGTRIVARMLSAMACGGRRNLMVLADHDATLFLSGRNIKNLNIKPVSDINAYDVMKSENIIFIDKQALDKVQQVVAL